MSSVSDLSVKARIRNCALQLFADKGFYQTTVRDIATAAGVSPGLIIHHFGSKDGLRGVVDDWMMEFLEDPAHLALLSQGVSAIAAFTNEHPELSSLVAYIATTLREGGPQADTLFDRLLAATEQLAAEAVASGIMRPSDDEPARCATLLSYSLGVIMLNNQLARHLGGATLFDPEPNARYTTASLDILNYGVLTDTTATHPQENA